MTALRQHFRHHPRLAAWLLAAALVMKLLVPAGFMPVANAGTIRIELCSGYGPMAMPMAGHHDDHGKPLPRCDFSALGAAVLTGNGPVLPAEPTAFPALAPQIARAAFDPPRSVRLRPPLRAPPII